MFQRISEYFICTWTNRYCALFRKLSSFKLHYFVHPKKQFFLLLMLHLNIYFYHGHFAQNVTAKRATVKVILSPNRHKWGPLPCTMHKITTCTAGYIPEERSLTSMIRTHDLSDKFRYLADRTRDQIYKLFCLSICNYINMNSRLTGQYDFPEDGPRRCSSSSSTI